MEKTVPAAGAETSGALPRVMRELIRTPVFRELLKLNLREAPHGSAAELARVLVFEDVDIFLSLFGSSPQAVNSASEFLLELARQLESFPPEVLRAFIRRMGAKVEVEAVKALPGAVSPLFDALLWSDAAAVQGLRDLLAAAANAALWGGADVLKRLEEAPAGGGRRPGLDAEAVAELINAGARTFGMAASSRPAFLAEVATHLDREALRAAADGALDAVSEAGISVVAAFSWALKAAWKIIKGKLKS